MSDLTDDEEERLVRRVARRMPVDPVQLADNLDEQSFILVEADREEGTNEISFDRPSKTIEGLFDGVHVKSNIRGEGASVYIGIGEAPGLYGRFGLSRYVPAQEYGYRNEKAEFRTLADRKRFCERLSQFLPKIFAEFYRTDGTAFAAETMLARQAAERYLRYIAASVDLHETLARLKAKATDAQWKQSQRLFQGEQLDTFDLADNWRVIWEIAALCHVLLWEFPNRPYMGVSDPNRDCPPTTDDIEVHRRIQIVASRLARAPGWPLVDSLVPNRPILNEETIPWRDGKPSLVAELFDEHLSAAKRCCLCGRPFYYLSHSINSNRNPPTAVVKIRCNAGHEATEDMAWNVSLVKR